MYSYRRGLGRFIGEFGKAWLFDDSIAMIGSAKGNIKTDKLRCFLVGSKWIREVK